MDEMHIRTGDFLMLIGILRAQMKVKVNKEVDDDFAVRGTGHLSKVFLEATNL